MIILAEISVFMLYFAWNFINLCYPRVKLLEVGAQVYKSSISIRGIDIK